MTFAHFRRLALVPFLLLCLAQTALALNLDFAQPDAPRRNQWELLAVTFTPPPGGATISLQDARGGLIISRPSTSATPDPASSQLRLLIPLPFLADADLPPNSWPIIVTLTSPSATEHQQINLPRSTSINLSPDGRSALRLLIPSDSPAPTLPPLSPLPTIITPLPEEEILTAPLLLFASADILYLSPQLAAKLPEDRAAALLATGLQLLILTDPQKSPLAHLPWQPLPADSPAFIAPASPLPRPQILDPRLAQSRILHIQAQAPRPTILLILTLPLAALVLLLLSRGLFRKPTSLFLATAIAFIALSLISILYLRTATPPTTLEVAWSTHVPSDILLSQSFTATAPLFAHDLRITAPQSTLLFPAFASPRPYFALQNAHLNLDTPTPNGLARQSSLTLSLLARHYFLYTTRSTELAEALAPSALTPTRGIWIDAGHILPTPATPSSEDTPILTQWAPSHPTLQPSLLAWYDLAMQASHRYFLELPSDPSAPSALHLTDLGPSPPSPEESDSKKQ